MVAFRGSLVLERSESKFADRYDIVDLIGVGSVGSISKVKLKKSYTSYNKPSKNGQAPSSDNENKDDDDEKYNYALKSIKMDCISDSTMKELENEVSILKQLDHPNIVKVYETYHSKNQNDSNIRNQICYIVMECCSGGDLLSRAPYKSEKQVKTICKDLISAIKYMHDHGVVHRDLKFENVMFETNNANAVIKVIDFGLSVQQCDDETISIKGCSRGFVGTLYTMAPEIVTKQKSYTSQIDMWSIGVIMYMLLSSKLPFYHKKRKKMIQLIASGEYSSMDSNSKSKSKHKAWGRVSNDAKDLISKLLIVDPGLRWDSAQALHHPWFTNLDNQEPVLEDDIAALSGIHYNLLQYRETSILKKVALNIIARNSTRSDILSLRKLFDKYDLNNDGVITYPELKEGLQESNYPDNVIDEIFNSMDINQDGQIMYTEFLASTLEARQSIEEERILEAFNCIDVDNSGYICKEEIRKILGYNDTTTTTEKKSKLGNRYSRPVSDDDEDDDFDSTEYHLVGKRQGSSIVDGIIKQIDRNNDGQISYNEFLKVFRTKSSNLITEDI